MNKRYYIPTFLLAFLFASCDLDINVNPDEPIGAPIEQLLPTVVYYGAQINYDHAEYGTYMTQTLTTGGRSQTGSLAYKSGWEFLTMNRHPQWRRHYIDVGANANEMNRMAVDKGAKNYELIGRTVILMSTLYTTDAFGDMPLEQAWKPGINTPKYDTQESIYKWMKDEVDKLIALSKTSEIKDASVKFPITKSIERVYGGDIEKWRGFLYGLKARIYLRNLPNLDRSKATTDSIIIAVNNAQLTWEEPRYKYDGGVVERNCPWGPLQPTINSWESRKNELDKAILSKYFAEEILGVGKASSGLGDDPRIGKIMKRRDGPKGDTDVKIRYLASNIGMEASYTEKNFPDLFSADLDTDKPVFTTNTSYISYMLTEELLLMKAEAEYWSGDKTAAHATTVEAATLNMQRHGVAARPMSTYLRNPNYLPEAGFNIGHLMRQKYICMYLQADQWTDMRRYKYSNSSKTQYDDVIIYPNLRRPYNLYEPYWSGNDEWVQRINYDPETEDIYNRAELERLGAFKNPEWLKKPMIWAK